MKCLLSAYACEPNVGSESEVGWGWAAELANQGHDVWVLTRTMHQEGIERELRFSSGNFSGTLHFIFYDIPFWHRKRGGKGVHLHYFLWQFGIAGYAKKLHADVQFDVVHHVTFASVRQPSFMGVLGIPFILGPVAGGESAPMGLRHGYSMRGWVVDFARDCLNFLVKFDPFMWYTFRTAQRIYVTSEQTLELLPKYFRKKAKVQLAIAWRGEVRSICTHPDPSIFKVLYVGNFLYLKGMHLGICAFSQFLEKFPNAQLTFVGKGPEELTWKSLIENLGIADKVSWHSWVSQQELNDYYLSHDVFLFPSLRDSGGMVVLEAMANGMPVICLQLGGPGVIVDNTCGLSIPVYGRSTEQVVSDICESLVVLSGNPSIKNLLGEGAVKRVGKFSRSSLISGVYLNSVN